MRNDCLKCTSSRLLTIISAQVLSYQFNREAHEAQRKDSEELKETLRQILTNQFDVQRILELQLSGEPIAEHIMEAGQRVSGDFRQSIDILQFSL